MRGHVQVRAVWRRRIRSGRRGRYGHGRSAGGVSHQVHLLHAIRRPQVDCENEEGAINVTKRRKVELAILHCNRVSAAVERFSRHLVLWGTMVGATYLKSISAPVLTSVTISRMHGGGVIGRRSCAAIQKCQWTQTLKRGKNSLTRGESASRGNTNLVAETTHSSSDGLLLDIQADDSRELIRLRSSLGRAFGRETRHDVDPPEQAVALPALIPSRRVELLLVLLHLLLHRLRRKLHRRVTWVCRGRGGSAAGVLGVSRWNWVWLFLSRVHSFAEPFRGGGWVKRRVL